MLQLVKDGSRNSNLVQNMQYIKTNIKMTSILSILLGIVLSLLFREREFSLLPLLSPSNLSEGEESYVISF